MKLISHLSLIESIKLFNCEFAHIQAPKRNTTSELISHMLQESSGLIFYSISK